MAEQKQTMKKIETKNTGKLAAIRVRGLGKVPGEIVDTLNMLNLHKRNFCSVFDDKPEVRGMLLKVNDMITWGEVEEETIKTLKEKRDEGKRFFRLSPPRGGFERKGIKVSFKTGGALGYRGIKINDLIKKMM